MNHIKMLDREVADFVEAHVADSGNFEITADELLAPSRHSRDFARVRGHPRSNRTQCFALVDLFVPEHRGRRQRNESPPSTQSKSTRIECSALQAD